MKTDLKKLSEKVKKLKAPYTAKQLLELRVKEIPYLIDTIVPLRSLIFVYGSSGTGKSSLLRQMALAISGAAKEFLGFRVNDHGKVVVLSTEDGIEAISMYLNKVEKKLGHPINNDLAFFDDPGSFYKDLQNLSKEHGDVKAVFVDCYSDAFDGLSGNDSSDARKFLGRYDRLAKQYGYPIIFLHHVPKSAAGKEANKNNMIGSQSNQAKSRVAIELQDTGFNVRVLQITKGNYLSDEEKGKVYFLKLEDMHFTLDSTREIFKEEMDNYSQRLKERVTELRADNRSWSEVSAIVKNEGFDKGTSKSNLNQKFGFNDSSGPKPIETGPADDTSKTDHAA